MVLLKCIFLNNIIVLLYFDQVNPAVVCIREAFFPQKQHLYVVFIYISYYSGLWSWSNWKHVKRTFTINHEKDIASRSIWQIGQAIDK